MAIGFSLTAHCSCFYDNSFLEFCHYPVGLPTQPGDIRCIGPLGPPSGQGRLYIVLIELHEMTECAMMANKATSWTLRKLIK